MISIELYEECKKLYLSGLSLSQICREKKIGRNNLARRFKKDKIEIRSCFSYSRKYLLKEDFFDAIDCQEKAYILGFIYADGSNSLKKRRVRISLAKRDVEILEKFSQILYGETILSYRQIIKNEKEYESVTLCLNSKHLSQQLFSLGVRENKSYDIEFPLWLDKNLYSHFLRGLIDGDGWISLVKKDSPKVGLISSRKMNDFLKEFWLKELDIKAYLCKSNKQDFEKMCDIRLESYRSCKILLDWLYQDAKIYLERKYLLSQKFLDQYHFRRNLLAGEVLNLPSLTSTLEDLS